LLLISKYIVDNVINASIKIYIIKAYFKNKWNALSKCDVIVYHLVLAKTTAGNFSVFANIYLKLSFAHISNITRFLVSELSKYKENGEPEGDVISINLLTAVLLSWTLH